MEKQKQIEEIKDWIDSMYGCDCAYYGVDGLMIAEGLYNAGYRKQSEGEWEEPPLVVEIIPLSDENCWDKLSEKKYEANNPYRCGVCKGRTKTKTNFCPNCGAQMKGGAE